MHNHGKLQKLPWQQPGFSMFDPSVRTLKGLSPTKYYFSRNVEAKGFLTTYHSLKSDKKAQKPNKGQGKDDATAPAEAVPIVLPAETVAVQPGEADKPDEKMKRKSSDDFDFSDFDKELRALTGDDGADGGGQTQWDKLMDDALKDDAPPVVVLEDDSEEEEEDEDEEESDVSSEASKPFVYKGDEASEESEDVAERRYLLERHSFVHLRDPGLADALIPKELAPEKTYRGLQAEKHDYKKLCKELGVQPLNKFLRNLANEEMDLSWYGMSAKEIVAVCKVLCNNTHVRRLYLRGNAAGQEGGDALAEMIENNYTITDLDIARTEILPSMQKICEALAMNIVIERLDMSRNDLTSKEMVFIRDYLKETTTLRELWLSRNYIEDPGLLYLSKGIFDNTSLELMDLSYNRLRGNKNTFPFFDAIANHPEFLSLDLAGNSLGDEVARGIARIMLNNANFQYINVHDNRLTKAVCGRLGKSLAKSFTMTTFIAGLNLWTMGHTTQASLIPLIAPLTNIKNEVPLEVMDLCFITPIYKQFQRTKTRVEKVRPDLSIIVGDEFGLCKGKKPDVHALVIRRAKIVCENFATPLEMLIDELRTEPKTMTQREFKKFIKSCNLYKDKVMTKSFMENFAIRSMDVNCEAIIAAYDKQYPNKTVKKTDEIDDEIEALRSGSLMNFKRERETSMQAMMKW